MPSKYKIFGGKWISVWPFQAVPQFDGISETVLADDWISSSQDRYCFVAPINFIKTFCKNFNLRRA
ncbi:hypothetical protein D3C73_1324830 [compost metagenome]